MKVVMVMRRAVLAALASALLNGCAYVDRLMSIGEQPPLSSVDNPTTRPGYKPVQMPMPAAQPAAYNPNSLWRNGSRAFFKDQRAHQIGDILTVKVNITDKANIENETKRTRTMTEDSGIANFFGKPKVPIIIRRCRRVSSRPILVRQAMERARSIERKSSRQTS